MKKYFAPFLLLSVLLLAACGESDSLLSKLGGTWEVDYDETIKCTLALQGSSEASPEQFAAIKVAIRNALGEGAYIGLDTSKKTISAKMMDEKFEGVPFKVARTKDNAVTIVYDNREDTFEVRDNDRLQVVNGGGVLVLKRR